MKPGTLRRFQGIAYMGLAIALVPLTAMGVVADPSYPLPAPAAPAITPAPAPPAPATTASTLNYSTREVVKLISSGIPEDVVKTYINNSPYAFSLTPDAIIELHNMGIPSDLTTEMLAHDRNMPVQPAQLPQPANTAPVTAPLTPQYPTDQTAMSPDDYSDYYNQLSPYGNWGYWPGYGYGWYPNPGLSYAYYPWGVLGFGSWCFVGGRGWCWFPHNGFHDGFHNGFHGGFNHGFNHGFAAGFNHGFNHGFTTAGSHSFAGNSMGGFHSWGGGGFGGAHVSHFGGGGMHFSGGGGGMHMSGGGGGHFGGGGGGGHH